jgi:hypothetical protein
MSNEENNVETAEVPAGDNVQISVEQICAAIVKTLGSVSVTLEDLIANYQDQSISVNQDPDTKVLTFTLVNNADIQVPAENE